VRPLVFLLVISAPFAFVAEARGTCSEFVVIITGNETGCWDVKIDAPGVILDEEWKSSFFYAKGAYCAGNGAVPFRPSMDAEGSVKIRRNGTILEAPIAVERDCPPRPAGFFAVIIIISALFAGVIVAKNP